MGTVDGMRGKMHTAPMPPPPPAHRHISGSDRRIIDSNGPDLRVYQAWKGSNIFCFGGRLIFGPDVRSLFLTVFMIVTPAILFCTFVSHELINEFQHHLGNLIEVMCAISTAYIMILLLLTSARDPGIIPRNHHPPDEDGSNISTDWAAIQGGGSSLPPMKDVLTTYENFRYRYDGKTNPYNLGYVRNIIEVFFTKIPKSKNSFREKIKVNSYSVYATSMSLGQSLSPEIPKTSFDVEVGKRQAVADEDFEEIQSHIDNVGGLERCGTQPRHINRDHKANWG
ncbi:hypothetical protein GH714_027086 [Hevea brasiliensis]|uniref:Uncharacterized protein n=1 Tax=Hevea brasiliensis TaxID=3981 RepID=A0A6A6MH90_HEVBR|nr:hypothetical protein GH714_027086 [Hevea brasiliensis]